MWFLKIGKGFGICQVLAVIRGGGGIIWSGGLVMGSSLLKNWGAIFGGGHIQYQCDGTQSCLQPKLIFSTFLVLTVDIDCNLSIWSSVLSHPWTM